MKIKISEKLFLRKRKQSSFKNPRKSLSLHQNKAKTCITKAKQYEKFHKRMKKLYFDHQMRCAAPIWWSKYTKPCPFLNEWNWKSFVAFFAANICSPFCLSFWLSFLLSKLYCLWWDKKNWNGLINWII